MGPTRAFVTYRSAGATTYINDPVLAQRFLDVLPCFERQDDRDSLQRLGLIASGLDAQRIFGASSLNESISCLRALNSRINVAKHDFGNPVLVKMYAQQGQHPDCARTCLHPDLVGSDVVQSSPNTESSSHRPTEPPVHRTTE